MRKTPYIITFVAVLTSFALSYVSFAVPDWVVMSHPESLPGVMLVRWGLYQRCERAIVEDSPSTNQTHTEYNCRDFPAKKFYDCQREIDNFCVLWSTAGYSSELSLALLAAALVALLVVTTGFSTRSRRRTAWQGVAALTSLHAILQIVTMAIVVDLRRHSAYPLFEHAKLGSSFYLSTISWSLDVFIIAGLLITAWAAKDGKRWAAGRHPYRQISG